MSYLNVTQDYTKTTYDGYSKNPKITIKTSTGKRLKNNVDYYVTRENNINVGYGTITVTGKNGYIGKWVGSILIRPIGTTIKSITSTRKSFTVKYEIAVEDVDGYQIEYCSSKDFSHSKKVTITDTSVTKKKISDLRPDCRYYVRIRTYQKVDGEKIFSKWCDTESVSTKE